MLYPSLGERAVWHALIADIPTTLCLVYGSTREKAYGGLTAKYDVVRLAWYESHEEREYAFRRERQIKKWNRAWEIRLIEELNPRWDDLYETLNC